MRRKRILLITGSILFVLGSFLIFIGFYLSFKRVPPNANPPILYFEFEKLYRDDLSDDKRLEQIKKDDQKISESKASKITKVMELEIPKINLKEPVYEGTSKRILMSGPGHISGTSYPNEKMGNCCISAHRVTFGGPFRKLDRLNQGDEIIIRYKGKKYFYKVIWIKRVKPKDIWVLQQTEIPSITLTTCDPPFSAKYRLIVRGVLYRSE